MRDDRAKTTIRDIARLVQASPSTVSAVLSGTWRARRISEATAERIQAVAGETGFSVNRQARGLRRGRSDMVGLILPTHDNRFFAATAQSFEAEARRRNLCPVVVSTLRDPLEETRTVARLIAYAIDALVIVGATDPSGVGRLCRAAGVRHVYVDLPGDDAPSVLSDNRRGARSLAETLLAAAPDVAGPRGRPHFLGGSATDDATARRIEGFRDAVEARGGIVAPHQVLACGYAPARALAEIARLRDRLGGLPSVLFVNAIPVFEGIVPFLVGLPAAETAATAVGCYDHDPIGSWLPFPVHMVRQNSEAMVARAFALIDEGVGDPIRVVIPPDLVPPRSTPATPHRDLG